MLTARSVTLCGLYLDLAGMRDCLAEAQSIGLGAKDMSVILPDGSVTMMPALGDTQRLQTAMQNRLGFSASAGPGNPARVAPFRSALTKTLLTLGVPVYDSERLEYKIRNGGILVAVRCNDSVTEKMREVLIQTGAQDLSIAKDNRIGPERCPFLRKETHASPTVDEWPQRSAHA
jgi:hypothetical protein